MTFNLNALLLALHLIAAAAWFGAGWYERLMVSPVIKRNGSAGVAHIRTHIARGGGARWFAPASMLTVLTGVLLYWRLDVSLASISGILVTVGAALGVAALVLGITVHRPAENRIKDAIAAGNDDLILAHAKQLERHTTLAAWLVTAAFLLMALRSMVA